MGQIVEKMTLMLDRTGLGPAFSAFLSNPLTLFISTAYFSRFRASFINNMPFSIFSLLLA
jgi:hypothetical protein